jgi:mannose-6-phosphate isomerase-like protein (cupin superfamily)
MQAWETSDLSSRRDASGKPYLEFLRQPSMSLGLYVLPAGGVDAQSPHGEDEVYLVTAGRARLRVGDEDRDVGPGSVVFVPARVPHRFHSIESELSALVLFAPAEGSATTRR